MPHTLTLQSIRPITHDVNELTFIRPEGYEFQPGQATDFALDRDGWRDEKRPFTFTSLPEAEHLQFTIKSYPSHDGVTEQIGKLEGGEDVLIEDAWGAISDHGPGTIIAGGAGITPFLSILRARQAEHGDLDGYRLIFANSCEKDIILREEWEGMDGLRTVFTVTDQKDADVETRKIDDAFLKAYVQDYDQPFYICGPRPMVNDVRDELRRIGVPEEAIVTENGW